MSILRYIFVYIAILMDKVIDFFFSLYWDRKKRVIPDLDKNHAFLAESAWSLAKKIKQKELKSEELVQAMIERMKQVNPLLNAIVADMYEAALEEAREIDRQIACGLSEEMAKKPFLGVPFTTKESQGVKGMPYTMGLWCRRNERADEDSEAVTRLRMAGAIPIATTNLPELLIWFQNGTNHFENTIARPCLDRLGGVRLAPRPLKETRNPVYGMTRNPHHTGRSPGGSSGAEAALTAAAATAISLCSDVGGSTRMPAFYCGQFGHHPTPGTTDTRGSFFRTGNEDSMYSLGFISRHVEDLAPLIKVIAGDKVDLLKLDREVDCKDIKYLYLESSKDCRVSPLRPEMTDAMRRVITKLDQDFNKTAEPYYHESIDSMYSLWAYCMTQEPGDYASMLEDGKGRVNGFKELGKKMVGMSKHCLFSILRVLELQTLPAPDPDRTRDRVQHLKDDLFRTLGANGVLLLPSAPLVAPWHYSPVLRPYNFAYWALVNVLKCPATQVPIGKNSQGLPIGIQVLAAPYNDALCLSVAKYLENEFGGAIMACNIEK